MKLNPKTFYLFLLVFFSGCLLQNSILYGQSPWHRWVQHPTQKLENSKQAAVQVDYPLSCINFDWNSGPDIWDTASQITYAYDPNGRMIERVIGLYGSGSYFNDFRETHAYTTSGFDTLTLAERWNGSNWDPSYRFLRTFDPYGNLTSSVGQTWNGIGWDTSSGYRASHTYHNTQQIASVIQESYQTGIGWNPTYRMEYSFDNLNRWDTVTGFLPNQGTWTNDKRIVGFGWRDFSKNQPDSARFEEYTTLWQNFQRFHVTYSQNESEEWIYDKFGVAWDQSERYLFNYDSLGNEILNEGYRWTGAWTQTDGLSTNYMYGISGERLEVFQALYNGQIYVNDNRQVYANFFTEAPEEYNNILNLSVFPSPSSGNAPVNFQFSGNDIGKIQICLYDMTGRLRLATNGMAQRLVQISIPAGLENGTYIYRVTSRLGTASGSWILQR
ncbi:MAG: Secretion system C-terminal sorting domain [Bacteroidota bacterium]|jgi:hypothetical protein